MNKNYLNSNYKFYESPQIPCAKYECSPIIAVQKYNFFNRRTLSVEKDAEGRVSSNGVIRIKVEMSSAEKQWENLRNMQNVSTPTFKHERDNNSRFDDRVNAPVNCKNSKIGIFMNNISMNMSILKEDLERPLLSNIFTSLKRSEPAPLIATKITPELSRETANKKKTIRRDIIDYITKVFRLDEIVIQGKRVKHLIDFSSSVSESGEDDNIHTAMIIKPFYEKNFKKLNYMYYRNSDEEDSVYGEKRENTKARSKSKRNNSKCNSLKQLQTSINSSKFKKVFQKEIHKEYENFTDYFTMKSESFNDPASYYDHCLTGYKNSLFELQSDYASKQRKVIDSGLISYTLTCINKLNRLYEIFFNCLKKISVNNNTKSTTSVYKNRKIIYYYESYDCTICNKRFETGQGLGGHMSRMHPNKSEKYKQKMLIRSRRTKFREIIQQAKRRILADHGFDYDELRETGDKATICSVIKDNHSEYKQILRSLKAEKKGFSLGNFKLKLHVKKENSEYSEEEQLSN